MLVPGLPDTLGAILGIADTIGKLVNKDDDDYRPEPEIIERPPVIVQQPSQPSSSNTDQVVNINLTLNFYGEDGKLLMTTKKDNV